MEVYWKDGQKSSLDSDENPNKRIIYIPQSYLNRVVDDEKKNTDIDDIIKEVLLQDGDFNTWYSLLHLKEKEIDESIDRGIRSLYENIDIYNENLSALKKVGDEKGVSEQIKKIKAEVVSIQNKLKLRQDEIDSFNSQMEEIKKDKLNIDFLEKDIKSLNLLKEVKISLYDAFDFAFESESISKDVERVSEIKSKDYGADWKKEIESLIDKYSKEHAVISNKNQKAISSLKPLQDKIDNQKVLTKKYKELEIEQKKQQTILNLKSEKEKALETIDSLTLELSGYVSEYYSIYLEAKDKIKLDDIDGELDFDVNTDFKQDDFRESFIGNFFDGRSINKVDYDYLTKYEFRSKQGLKDFMHNVIWDILKGKLPFKNQGASKRQVIVGLLKNWFIHNYKVEYQGDQINDMSPGKKSFVLLRLLIDLDNSKCPILIDQPEDDLDNRSIYSHVVKFLRKRKSERQIIIATHNPNLVLGSDAELVIVANQNGSGVKNKSSQFEYVSGAIEYSQEEDSKIEEVLYKRGIQEHICDILEGGKEAFEKRRNKYNMQ